MTYRDVAEKVGLDTETTERYVKYMTIRWPDTEEQKCQDGYAYEWAERFAHGIEYGKSDMMGQVVLEGIDKDARRDQS